MIAMVWAPLYGPSLRGKLNLRVKRALGLIGRKRRSLFGMSAIALVEGTAKQKRRRRRTRRMRKNEKKKPKETGGSTGQY